MNADIENTDGAINITIRDRFGDFFFHAEADGEIYGYTRSALTEESGSDLDGAQEVVSAFHEFAELVKDLRSPKVESAQGWAHGRVGSRRSAIYHNFGTFDGRRFVSLCGKSTLNVREGRILSSLQQRPPEDHGDCKICIREMRSAKTRDSRRS